MDPAAGVAHRLGDDVHERGDVVVGHLLAHLGGVLGWDGALFGEGVHHGQLHLQPRVELALLRPDHAHLRAGIAVDHTPRIRASRTAAFLALSTPTAATGTPGGIWAIDSSASRPPAMDVFDVSGTPMTGRSVCAATTPGSAADRPAPAMITRRPRMRALPAYSATVSGSRCALITRISKRTPRSLSSSPARSIAGMSLFEPITIPTSGASTSRSSNSCSTTVSATGVNSSVPLTARPYPFPRLEG